MTKNKVLQKFLAETGHCSRRQAEELIKRGRVQVNGETAEPGQRVSEGDDVRVDEEVLVGPKEKIYIKLNKPAGYTCTNRKFSGEKNVFDLVPSKEKLFVVGRLDKDSRGLVLLTNDGDWANQLSHPSFGCEKEYEVSFEFRILNFEYEIKKRLLTGVDIGDGDGVVKAKKVAQLNENKFKVVLDQGKKRQIRRMFQALGVEVQDLKRVKIDDINLGSLKEGNWEPLKNKEGKNGELTDHNLR